jgi:hypothetical protein
MIVSRCRPSATKRELNHLDSFSASCPHPQQNAAHERMHKTLKRGAIRPPRATLAAQQRAFNQFRRL